MPVIDDKLLMLDDIKKYLPSVRYRFCGFSLFNQIFTVNSAEYQPIELSISVRDPKSENIQGYWQTSPFGSTILSLFLVQ